MITHISDNKITMVPTVGEAHVHTHPSVTIATCFTNSQIAYFRFHLLRVLVAFLECNEL